MLHPGYTYPTEAASLQLQQNYWKQLQSAELCIICTSTFRYRVRKFVEAALAGCLVLSDLPADGADELQKFIVVVDRSHRAQHLLDVVKWWLDHPLERIKKARAAQANAMAWYTCRTLVENLVFR